MKLDQYSGYVGRLKQPLEMPERDCPTMFMLADSMKYELDLILLTPGTLCHAYKYIKSYNAQSVRLFIPSLRPEFISDIFNLYMILKDTVSIKWVFPKSINHTTFTDGQIKCDSYINQFDRNICIQYVENPNVDDVYDIIVSTMDDTNYFSMYFTESQLQNTLIEPKYTFIHLPMSSSLYGGLTMTDLTGLKRRQLRLFQPHSFVTVEEYYKYMNRKLPDKYPYYDDPDSESGFPPDYNGNITDQEIIENMR